MKKYSVNELREMFLTFFESKGHLRLPSFSLIPQNDNSLLIINSGMAPLKPYFKGIETPPRKRVTTCQKCIRTGDIENIGLTARHGTFFEMLGNFSFGDYFKKEAITWSWEFLTVTLGLDKERLYPSVYKDDDEAYNFWHDMIGVPSEKIFKFGKEDNFWEHGQGPCGPCSEIYYDRGEKYGCGKDTCTVGCDCDRYMEIWNNVFTQFDNDGNGNYTELAQKNIDTGMGLERLAVAVQDVESIFEVDTNRELMDNISMVTHHIYKDDKVTDVSLRIIADHIKSCTFMISDGILPSNEGRGYVLRRLLRRAVRHGRILGVHGAFMANLAKVVIKLNGEHYTELKEKEEMILNVLNAEESKFNQTIDQGLQILNDKLSKNNTKILSGDDAFLLYDTYGFPIDLTKEILKEKNMTYDEDRFKELMEIQKHTARNARKTSNYMGADISAYENLDVALTTEFVGYDKLVAEGTIKAIIKNKNIADKIVEGEEGIIITDKTPFYATMGGQVGDSGIITIGESTFEVYDTIKILNTKIGHIGKVTSGALSTNSICELSVDKNRREHIAINHTATHLLQAALRDVIGNHVEQAGSLVEDDRLRFDFTHFSALTKEQIDLVEEIVNKEIMKAVNVDKVEMKLAEAKKLGAMALFGEKYGEVVRTIRIGDFSFELCGGTHINNTREIKCFKILSETGIAAGVRRIEAITADTLIKYLNDKYTLLKNIETALKSNDSDAMSKVETLVKENKELRHSIDTLKKQISNATVSQVNVKNVNGIQLIVEKYDDKGMNDLKDIADSFKDKYKDCLVVVFGVVDNTVSVVAAISDKAVESGYKAGVLLKEILKEVDGNGGGKDKFAMGQGKNASKIDAAINKVYELVKEPLN